MMKKKTAQDYKFLRLLGEGSFSSVYLAVDAAINRSAINKLNISQQNESGIELESNPDETDQPIKKQSKIRMYAIKVCQKSHIKKQNKQTAIMREKEIMNMLNQNPNRHFIKLHCTFQDSERLYFVMTYAENGDLLNYMQDYPLSLPSVKKYTSQLLEALEHIHKLGIVHRDLKPENILLNDQLNILITDFGSAQIYSGTETDSKTQNVRRNSFVGTAQYVSPEMLRERQASNKSDLWAFGVIIYQMITNHMPFNAPNEYLIYQKIQSLDYEFPVDFDKGARDLISSLIKLNPLERLGASDDLFADGYTSIRRHIFLNYDTGTIQEKSSLLRDNVSDLQNLDDITPGLDEAQLLRLLTIG